MGMASSQVRLLAITSRIADIEYKENMLSMQKLDLARQTQAITKDYNNALNTKVLKWSNNSGVTYTDITYAGLMRPGEMNQYSPYLLTDSRDRVVLDSKYAEYAKYIEANGGYSQCRYNALEMATGIDADKIAKEENLQVSAKNAENKYLSALDLQTDALETCAEADTVEDLIGTNNTGILGGVASTMGTILNTLETTKGKLYSGDFTDMFEVGGKSGYGNQLRDSLVTALSAMTTSSTSELTELVEDALDATWEIMDQVVSGTTNQEEKDAKYGVYISANADQGTNKEVGIVQDDFYKDVIELILTNLGMVSDRKVGYYDFTQLTQNSKKGDTAEEKIKYAAEGRKIYDSLEAETAARQAEYTQTTAESNSVLTSEEEQKIEFFDKLFVSIEDKGWVQNDQVSDTDYLNQMLQNNLYTMTTVDCEVELPDAYTKTVTSGTISGCEDAKKSYQSYNYDSIEVTFSTTSDEQCYIKNTYKNTIASNMDNVFSVSDTDARDDAYVEYSYKKSIIEAKESRIDTRLTTLKTELSALNKTKEGIESVAQDNVNTYFKLFTSA